MNRNAQQLAVAAAVMFTAADALAGGAALPQLDAATFPNQLFWLVVTFAAMYLVVARAVVPTVSAVLAARAETIADAIAKAEAFKQHADAAEARDGDANKQARTKAMALVAQAQAEAAQAQAQALAALDAKLDAKGKTAAVALDAALAKAQGELDAAAIDVARVIAEKLLGSAVDEASIKAHTKAA